MPDSIPDMDESEFMPIVKRYFELLRHKGIVYSEITHGNREYGKDIVVKVGEIVGHDTEMWAAQVKAVEIHDNISRRSHDGHVDNIAIQVDRAFEVPFRDSNGDDHQIKRVFVITNKNVTANAKDVIRSKFQNRSVYIFGGQEFIGLYEEAQKEKDKESSRLAEYQLWNVSFKKGV